MMLDRSVEPLCILRTLPLSQFIDEKALNDGHGALPQCAQLFRQVVNGIHSAGRVARSELCLELPKATVHLFLEGILIRQHRKAQDETLHFNELDGPASKKGARGRDARSG